MSNPQKFRFPEEMSRRDRWLFEKHAGMTFGQFRAIASDPERHDEFTAQMEAALLLVAVKRVRPSATIDDVLDSDWELEDMGEAAGEADSPLPAPQPQ